METGTLDLLNDKREANCKIWQMQVNRVWKVVRRGRGVSGLSLQKNNVQYYEEFFGTEKAGMDEYEDTSSAD